MSQFYGTVQGSHTQQATRRGHAYVETVAASWDGAIRTRLWLKDNTKWVTIERIPWKTNGDYVLLYDGPLQGLTAKL